MPRGKERPKMGLKLEVTVIPSKYLDWTLAEIARHLGNGPLLCGRAGPAGPRGSSLCPMRSRKNGAANPSPKSSRPAAGTRLAPPNLDLTALAILAVSYSDARPARSSSGAPGNTTSKISTWSCPGTASSSSPASAARASPPWPSTSSMPRGSAATWSPCRPTPGSSWSSWTSRTWSTSRACPRPSPSSSAAPPGTPAPPWPPPPKSTTTSGCCSPGWAPLTATSAAGPSRP